MGKGLSKELAEKKRENKELKNKLKNLEMDNAEMKRIHNKYLLCILSTEQEWSIIKKYLNRHKGDSTSVSSYSSSSDDTSWTSSSSDETSTRVEMDSYMSSGSHVE